MVLVANDDDRLFYHHTGLRGRRLLAVVVCLGVLCILAIIALTVGSFFPDTTKPSSIVVLF
jgi:hypothetical protein